MLIWLPNRDVSAILAALAQANVGSLEPEARAGLQVLIAAIERELTNPLYARLAAMERRNAGGA